ncbi:hypothetical protein AB0L53_46975 [Nonomuraea sp. NPDC052129]|uniref:hypothetical protein n=1 Tax=Nonomuraea sp. NPDC052129 TaxID=3154651 RepID=UPI00341779BF
MSLLGNGITALVTLLAVLLGGWLTIRNQDRLWNRDHARQWRDIRLEFYREFLSAYQQYVAFALEPTAKITAVPHPRRAKELMPFFDESGRPYKERFESAATAARLVSGFPETRNDLNMLVKHARAIAAARATATPGEIPSELFDAFLLAERTFQLSVRRELGLPAMSLDISTGLWS